MRREAEQGSVRDAGFTLLEVLAAVAIAGFILSAVASIVTVTLAGVRSAADRVVLVEAGRTLLETLPQGDALRAGTKSGTLGTTTWRIDVVPAPDTPHPPRQDPTDDPGWRPATVAIAARTAAGRNLLLRTQGLIRRDGP